MKLKTIVYSYITPIIKNENSYIYLSEKNAKLFEKYNFIKYDKQYIDFLNYTQPDMTTIETNVISFKTMTFKSFFLYFKYKDL